ITIDITVCLIRKLGSFGLPFRRGLQQAIRLDSTTFLDRSTTGEPLTTNLMRQPKAKCQITLRGTSFTAIVSYLKILYPIFLTTLSPISKLIRHCDGYQPSTRSLRSMPT